MPGRDPKRTRPEAKAVQVLYEFCERFRQLQQYSPRIHHLLLVHLLSTDNMLRSSALCSQFALSGTGLDQKNHPHHHGLRCSESCCEIAADRPVDSFVPWLQTWGEEGSVQMMMMMTTTTTTTQ